MTNFSRIEKDYPFYSRWLVAMLLLFSLHGPVLGADEYSADDSTKYFGIGIANPSVPLDILSTPVLSTTDLLQSDVVVEGVGRRAQDASGLRQITTSYLATGGAADHLYIVKPEDSILSGRLDALLEGGAVDSLFDPADGDMVRELMADRTFPYRHTRPMTYDAWKAGYEIRFADPGSFNSVATGLFGVNVQNRFSYHPVQVSTRGGGTRTEYHGLMETVSSFFAEQYRGSEGSSPERGSLTAREPILSMSFSSFKHLTDSEETREFTRTAVAIGGPPNSKAARFPQETLDVYGGMRIRDAYPAQSGLSYSPGTMAFRAGDFMGYDGKNWLSLSRNNGGSGFLLRHAQLSFGRFGGTQNSPITPSYIINSTLTPTLSDWSFSHALRGTASGRNYMTDDYGTSGGLAIATNGTPRLIVKGNGNVYVHDNLAIGLGSRAKGTMLTVAGAVHIGPGDLSAASFDYSEQGHTDEYLLWVQKGVVSEDFSLVEVDHWSDHVFDEEYDLMPLLALEDHIEATGHLPGVPSAEEVQRHGYRLHDMNRILLEKLEELTLHTIAHQKDIDAGQDAVSQQRQAMRALQAELAAQAEVIASLSGHAPLPASDGGGEGLHSADPDKPFFARGSQP